MKNVPYSVTSRRSLAAIGALAIAAFGVSAWLSGGFRGANAFTGLLVSLVYTVSISVFASAATEWLWPLAEGRSRAAIWAVRLGSMLLAVACGTLLGHSLLWHSGILRGRDFWRSFYFNLQFAAFITCTFGLALMTYEYWRAKYEHAELERERALKLATEARLASLESRIHPHFLFNTLNSISSLIHSDPAKADEQLQRLCALLRFSLDSSQTPLVPLSQELKIVRDYLDIEQTRFGPRLAFSIDVDPTLHAHSVPPLSLQTLVENSVKHVIAKARHGGEIRISATAAGDTFTLSVHDGGPGVSPAQLAPGHGLDILQSRLATLFPGRARLVFEAASVRMELPA